MVQERLNFDLPPRELPSTPPKFHGASYVAEWDEERLTGQWRRVWEVLKDGRPRTLRELEAEIRERFGTGDMQSAISARIRQLRAQGFPIPPSKRRGDPTDGAHEYWAEL